MKVGWVGLGKLGLPCALALQVHGGHEITGYDVSDWCWKVLAGRENPHKEQGFLEAARQSNEHEFVRAATPGEVVAASEIIFVAVQTPHAPLYGGEVPMPDTRRDFEYSHLVQACRDICRAAQDQRKHVTLAVVSTVLPGTVNRLIRPLLNPYVDLIYTPQFIAMGTTIPDFLNPEFIICGAEGQLSVDRLRRVFAPLHTADRLFITDYTTAETIKVFYNVFISAKIVFANTLMETCHKTGADCDAVVDALSKATDRVVSPKYLRGGMGDGGACHPRDLIALSWLAERLDLSYDFLGAVAEAREAQSRWLAQLAEEQAELAGLPLAILGRSYKPESDLTYGSPALLLRHYLKHEPRYYDPHAPGLDEKEGRTPFGRPHVYLIGTRHMDFAEQAYPRRSVVIDPFGYVPDQQGVTVIRVGRR